MDRRHASRQRHDLTALLSSPRRSPLLTLREVRESGLPAVFLEYGEALLYVNGELYSLTRRNGNGGSVGRTLPERVFPERLPPEILECAVGIEHGWRHVAGCPCRFCLREGHGEAAA